MTTKIERPALYHIKNPLSDKKLADQALASFSDADVAEYKSEYEEYRTVQSTAVNEMHELVEQTRSYFTAMFGSDSKQSKYLERMVRNGELLTDRHSELYPHPSTVQDKIQQAREKYCSFLSDDNAPKVSGDDTLQEINNATTFLLGKGLELNVDFTISNAISLAMSTASEEFDDAMVDEQQIPATQYNMMVLDNMEFDASKYSILASRGYYQLRCDDMNWEKPESCERLEGSYMTYRVSFSDLVNGKPLFMLCQAG